ncbi:DUF2797 domain-containing protein [Candidatus Thorarchaeota archaeon]|nr:MAG: DUF2797 domain-containing protein [Candidatus Thorarchaeota archaeon]
MQIVNVIWSYVDSSHFDSGVQIWREGDPNPGFLPLLKGREISWVIRGPKRCIGSVNESGKLIPCPENSLVFGSGQKCGPCSAIDIIDPCIKCDGRRCDAIEARRLQCESTDYVVYAVVFNDRTLKVGVSSKGRALIRWVEQGADFGAVLREIKGGRVARRVEDRMGRQQGVTKQVRSERKSRALLDTLDISGAEEVVREFVEHSKHLELDEDIHLQSLAKFYSLSKLDTRPTPWRKRSDPIDGRALIGTIVGMKGSLMVLAIESSLTVVDLRQIIGYSIDQDSDITLVTQTGLMDFF